MLVLAGFAATLLSAACRDRVESEPPTRREGAGPVRRARVPPGPDRFVCAIDRLAESRLPRTLCLTAREWRGREEDGLRRE